jgi:hypothetical protein
MERLWVLVRGQRHLLLYDTVAFCRNYNPVPERGEQAGASSSSGSSGVWSKQRDSARKSCSEWLSRPAWQDAAFKKEVVPGSSATEGQWLISTWPQMELVMATIRHTGAPAVPDVL